MKDKKLNGTLRTLMKHDMTHCVSHAGNASLSLFEVKDKTPGLFLYLLAVLILKSYGPHTLSVRNTVLLHMV